MVAYAPRDSLAAFCIGADLARIGPIRMGRTVPTTMRHWERMLSVPDTAEQIRQVLELFRYHVNDVTFALHAATTAEHAGREDNPALPLEQA